MGNYYLSNVVSSWTPEPLRSGQDFIVQLILQPRSRSGLQAIMEDADDVGRLQITETALLFHGGSIRMSIPFGKIPCVNARNIGPRGLFIYGQRLNLKIAGHQQFTGFEIAERSSSFLWTSRRITRELREELERKCKPVDGVPENS
jgi:hypothetical protein